MILQSLFKDRYRLRGFAARKLSDGEQDGYVAPGLKAEDVSKLKPKIILLNVEDEAVATILVDMLHTAGCFQDVYFVGFTRFTHLSDRDRKIVFHKAYKLEGLVECIVTKDGQDQLVSLVDELLV